MPVGVRLLGDQLTPVLAYRRLVAADDRLAAAGERVDRALLKEDHPHAVGLAPGQPLEADEDPEIALDRGEDVLLGEVAAAVPGVHRLVLGAQPGRPRRSAPRRAS